ncbi:MAG: hypothetical protein IJQ07_00945 [Clostridia bacterium]|nr:hypothetical protein [Clostridia bacterium]
MAKERRPGSMGYAEAMVIEYNGKKKKDSAYRLSITKLNSKDASLESDTEDEDFDESEDVDSLPSITEE